MKIDNCSAVVTGGASGLGATTARLLSKAGARVALLDLNNEAGHALADETNGHFVNVNVTNEQSVADALDEVGKVVGHSRILVNCAGIGTPQRAVGRDGQAATLSDFGKIIEVNL